MRSDRLTSRGYNSMSHAFLPTRWNILEKRTTTPTPITARHISCRRCSALSRCSAASAAWLYRHVVQRQCSTCLVCSFRLSRPTRQLNLTARQAGHQMKQETHTCASAAMAAALATFSSAACRLSLSRATWAAALSAKARKRPSSKSSSLTHQHTQRERERERERSHTGMHNS